MSSNFHTHDLPSLPDAGAPWKNTQKHHKTTLCATWTQVNLGKVLFWVLWRFVWRMKNTRQTAEFEAPKRISVARGGKAHCAEAAARQGRSKRARPLASVRLAAARPTAVECEWRGRARKNNTWARGTVSSGISTFSLPMRKDTAERLGCGLPHVVWRCVLPRDRIGGVNPGLAASVLSSLPSFVFCFSFCILSSSSFSCCRTHGLSRSRSLWSDAQGTRSWILSPPLFATEESPFDSEPREAGAAIVSVSLSASWSGKTDCTAVLVGVWSAEWSFGQGRGARHPGGEERSQLFMFSIEQLLCSLPVLFHHRLCMCRCAWFACFVRWARELKKRSLGWRWWGVCWVSTSHMPTYYKADYHHVWGCLHFLKISFCIHSTHVIPLLAVCWGGFRRIGA